MITAKIINTEFSFPVYSVFVNFTDDLGRLPQPQTQQITFSADTLTNLTKDTLQEKIQEYIASYEQMFAIDDSLKDQVDVEITSSGVVSNTEVVK